MRLWTVCKRFKAKIVDFELGTRWSETFQRLYDRIKEQGIQMFYTDHWNAYEDILPKDKHKQGKDNTFTAEWWNNLLRHYTARFHRKSHCYSKSILMVKYTILLFMYKEVILSILD